MADCGLVVFLEYSSSGSCYQPDVLPAVYLRYASGIDDLLEQAFQRMDDKYLDDAGRGAVQLIRLAPEDSVPQLRLLTTSRLLADPEFYSPGDRGLFVVHCYHDRWDVKRYDYPETNDYEPYAPTVPEFTFRKSDAQVSQTSLTGGL